MRIGAVLSNCSATSKSTRGSPLLSSSSISLIGATASPLEARISPSSMAASIRADGPGLIAITVRVTVVVKTGRKLAIAVRIGQPLASLRCIKNRPLARDLVFPLLPLQHVRLSGIFGLDRLYELPALLAPPKR